MRKWISCLPKEAGTQLPPSNGLTSITEHPTNQAVLDTTCLLAILPRLSPYRTVFDTYRNQHFDLAVSTPILAEYEEILTSRTTATIVQNVLELINRQPNTLLSTVYCQWGLITADYDDTKFVDCALATNADYSVINDRHFNQLSEHDFPAVAWLRLEAFSLCFDKQAMSATSR